MTLEQIIELIKEQKELYIHQVQASRNRMQKHMSGMTSQQIAQDIIYIQDIESRAYALQLLIEDLEDLK